MFVWAFSVYSHNKIERGYDGNVQGAEAPEDNKTYLGTGVIKLVCD
jgi:hypothetical protein